MKKITYTSVYGKLCVTSPTEGARLAYGVTFPDGSELSDETPRPVDTFLRRWPVVGAVANWAETEDEFVARIALKDVPAAATDVQIVAASAIPADRTFRNAWKSGNKCVEQDIAKCKVIAHERRRARREVEFKPHDDVIAKQIPGASAAESEAARQAIRAKYAAIQSAIDAAGSVDEIKAALS